jgi:subtilase family serine protease
MAAAAAKQILEQTPRGWRANVRPSCPERPEAQRERSRTGSSSALVRPARARLARAGAALAGALAVAGAVAAVGAPAAATASAATTGTHMVPAVLAGLPLATPEGPAPAGQEMTIGVALQRPNTAGEVQLYEELYNPSSPEYQQFLTPAEFNQTFGVPASESSATESWLTAGGLSIVSSSPDGDYFTAQGTVAQLDALFAVTIGSYTYAGRQFLANDVPPSVPGSLPIDAVVGLDTVHRFALGSLTSPGDEGVLTPQDLWGVYDDPGSSALTNATGTSDPSTLESSKIDLGQGQTMGIFGEGETSSVVAQLRLFESAMGLPKVPVRTVETEGGPDSAYGDNTGAIEWYLDSQSSTGMAPDVSELDLYFAKSLFDTDIFADFDDWANDPNGPREMNASFGECEENPTNPVTGPLAQYPYGTEFGDELEAVGDPMLRQAAIEGRTLFSSAGDTGSGCPELVAPVAGAGNGVAVQPVPMASYPCDSAYVVCVGGTVVSANGTTYPTSAERASETSWTFSGGGSSYFIPEPGFQGEVANIDHPCLSTPSGDLYPPTGAPICRGVPDVSDMSGNITGDAYFIYIDGEPSSEGGTSLSSPLMMGQWARVQAGASVKVQRRGGLGFADPTIYRQAGSADACTSSDTAPCTGGSYGRDFFDVTGSEYGAGNGAYSPGPGWDYASGWGSLNVANFIADVDGTTNAAEPAAAPEKAAVSDTTVSMTSPQGNATDPVDVSLGDEASLDLTGASLSASASGGITATLTGPGLGALPPPDATGGNSYYVAWLYQGTVYYALAQESAGGTWSFTSGSTGTDAYDNAASSAATGTVDSDSGTVTIQIPAAEVGSPPKGALLQVPQAFDQLDAASTPIAGVDLTTDSSDDLVPVSQDGGRSVSRGVSVRVGR